MKTKKPHLSNTKAARLPNALFALHVCIAFDATEMRRIKQASHRENEKKVDLARRVLKVICSNCSFQSDINKMKSVATFEIL